MTGRRQYEHAFPWLALQLSSLTRRYYLNGADAFRLKLLLPVPERRQMEHDAVTQMAALSAA